MQDRIRCRSNLEQAVRARIDAAIAQLVELAFYAARFAEHRRAAEANFHDVLKASLLIRKAGEELADAEGLNCGRVALRHAILLAQLQT